METITSDAAGILIPDLVLDGHDGVGKSTVAMALARRLNGSVLKPFNDSLGDHIAWLWQTGCYAEANDLCLRSVYRILSTTKAPRPWIFDRHWVTMWTVLPEEFHARWRPLPHTVVLTADTKVMMERLAERGEDPLDSDHHDHYRKIYVELGTKERSLIVDTSRSEVDETTDLLVQHWATLGPVRGFSRSLPKVGNEQCSKES